MEHHPSDSALDPRRLTRARTALRERHVDPFPSSWEEASKRLVLEPRPRTHALATHLKGPESNALPAPIEVELDPASDLVLTLGVDLRGRAPAITQAELDGWQVSHEDAVAAACASLEAELDRPWEEAEPGIFRAPWRSRFEASRMLARGFARHLPKTKGDPVLLIDHEGTLFLVGASDPEAVSRLAARDATSGESLLNRGAIDLDGTIQAIERLPPITRSKPFRFDGERFVAVPYASLSARLSTLDEGIGEDASWAFAWAAYARRAGMDLGPVRAGEVSIDPTGLPFARVVELVHHVADSEHVAAGRPIPHEPISRRVLAIEADLFASDVVLPAAFELALVQPPQGVRVPPVRHAANFDSLLALPGFAAVSFRWAGLPMLLARKLSAHAIDSDTFESTFRVLPGTWEGPHPLAGVDATWDSPEETEFSAPINDQDARSHTRVRRMKAVLWAALAVFLLYAGVSHVRCGTPRGDLVAAFDALADDVAAAGLSHDALVFHEVARFTDRGGYVERADFTEYLTPEPLPAELEARLRSLLLRTHRLRMRCEE